MYIRNKSRRLEKVWMIYLVLHSEYEFTKINKFQSYKDKAVVDSWLAARCLLKLDSEKKIKNKMA